VNDVANWTATQPPAAPDEPKAAERRPTVSIIVTNHNYADYVGEAVDSALAQTYPHCEVIVVDDGSTDDSREVLARYRDDGRVNLLYRPNGGQAAAMNTGFAASHGEIVMFVDADDALKPTAAEAVVAHWSDDLSRCQFPLEVIDRHGGYLGLHPFNEHLESGDVYWKIVLASYFWFIPTTGNAFARAALKPLFPLPEKPWRLCSDHYIVVLSAAFGPVRTLAEPLGCYRAHGSNNWHGQGRAEQMRNSWLQRFRLWRDLADQLGAADPAWRLLPGEASVRDYAALHLYRRLFVTSAVEDSRVPAGEFRSALLAAWWCLAAARIRFRHKLLYAAFLALASAGRWLPRRVTRWPIHHCLRPGWVQRRVARLKGEDFDEWMTRREAPEPLPSFPLNRAIHFGSGQDSVRFQWYGWDNSDAWLSWGVGARAALVGRLPVAARRIRLTIDVFPYVVGPLRAQRLVILANGAVRFDEAISGDRRISVMLETLELWAHPTLVIEFRFPDAVMPRHLNTSVHDYRLLGFAFRWLALDADVEETDRRVWPFVPLGRKVEGAENLSRLLGEGWHPVTGDVAPMARRSAELNVGVLHGAAFDHAVSVAFAPIREEVVRRCDVRFAAGSRTIDTVDIVQNNEPTFLVRRGTIPQDGRLTLSLQAGNLLAGDAGPDVPAAAAVGPRLRSLKIERLDLPKRYAVFPIGRPLRFQINGNARYFMKAGWRTSDGKGTLTNESPATLTGLLLQRHRDIFLSVVVYPPTLEGPFADQAVRVTANGQLLACYDIEGPGEITAIIPGGLVGEDFVLNLGFEASVVASPADLGVGQDHRVVGIGIETVLLEHS
jgi:hypothetical protein